MDDVQLPPMEALNEPATLISLATFVVVVLLFVAVAWSKFSELPGGAKLAVIAAGCLISVMALWIIAPAQAEALGIGYGHFEAAVRHRWNQWDGFTREYPIVGLLLLAALPLLLLPPAD
jgi:accessory gene regulator protein AgrB